MVQTGTVFYVYSVGALIAALLRFLYTAQSLGVSPRQCVCANVSTPTVLYIGTMSVVGQVSILESMATSV